MKTTNNNNNQTILLSNGRSVHPDLLEFIRYVVEERIPAISPDNAFTLKQICGEEKWDMLSKVNKIEAGYCMVHLVKKGEVPFKAVKDKGDNNKRYQLTSTKLGMRIP